MTGERKSRNIIIGLLCAIVLFMGIGYASLKSELEITGDASISNTWNVQITDIQVQNTTGKAVAGTPTSNATSANFEAQLVEPGDSVTYNVTVTNGGSINAVLTSVNEEFQNLETDSIIYTLSDANPKATDKLASGETHNFVVTATYKETAVGENAPTEEEKTKAFSLQMVYNQDLTAN